MQRAVIVGLSGESLTEPERDFLAIIQPAGIILFSRNVKSPIQVSQLIEHARCASGADAFLVLADQEGGRVQRLGPPHWPKYPAAAAFGRISANGREAALRRAFLYARMMARDLHTLGINTACAPVLDVPVPGADKVIGDRAYGTDADAVVAFGGEVADGLLAGGVLPIIKHIPGHGRAFADSHFALPAIDTPLDVLRAADFAPFVALRHLPMAMTAHVILTAVDREAPVTVSKIAIDAVIRGTIGFDGLLMSDDISMRALSGSLQSRTAAAFEAGCDIVLHCNGRLDEMEDVASAAPLLKGDAKRRFETAFEQLRPPAGFDMAEAQAALEESLAASA